MTLTKEWLQKTITELEEERDAIPGAVNEDAAMALAAMKLALASMTAEPVGEVVLGEYDDCGCHPDARVACIAADGQADWENFKDGTRLYTAPPAPAVPDELLSAMEEVLRISDRDHDAWHKAKAGILSCRAAMLQGAACNSPAIPDGWVACSERMPAKGQEVLCTDQFENYETALYDTGYIPGPAFFATTAGEFHPTHWMPLPAAPQQEVK